MASFGSVDPVKFVTAFTSMRRSVLKRGYPNSRRNPVHSYIYIYIYIYITQNHYPNVVEN